MQPTFEDIAESRISVDLVAEAAQVLHDSDVRRIQSQAIQELCVQSIGDALLVRCSELTGYSCTTVSGRVLGAGRRGCQGVGEGIIDGVGEGDDGAAV